MGSMESNARWQQMASLRDELETPAVVDPDLRQPSRRQASRALAEGAKLRGGAVVHGRLDADLGRAQPATRRLSRTSSDRVSLPGGR